jgi:plasmid stabilization system protein ParE
VGRSDETNPRPSVNFPGLSIVTRTAAAAEIDAAYRWYERERPGLGEEFLAAVNDLVGVIAEHPQRFQATHRDLRRALLRRFPYSIFYRLVPDHIVVVACFHSKRNPTRWRARR